MKPLDPAGAGLRFARSWVGAPHAPGLLALRHALEFPGSATGLWGDHPEAPQTVALVREGAERLEVFGAGDPGVGVAWLLSLGRAFTLHGPDRWHHVLAREGTGTVRRGRVETWSGAKAPAKRPAPVARPLTADDGPAFVATVEPWCLRGWGDFSRLVAHGAAFGVPSPGGARFAAVAWVFDQAGPYDAVGVFTAPRFRRLGLARSAALALIYEIAEVRGKVPLWSNAPGNTPSRALAKALNFSPAADEPLSHWTPITTPPPET